MSSCRATNAKAKKYVTGFARLGRWVGPTQLSPNVVAPRRFIQGGYMTIRIPPEVDPCEVARVIDHEVAHLAGLANRFEHAQVMLSRAETRAKRAQTILMKWRRRVSAMRRSAMVKVST